MKLFGLDRKLQTTEKQFIERIKLKTKQQNLNNITRTIAYLNFYRKHPEIEWAFLAHMVSRNAGWNMTDLKGDLLPRIMSFEELSNFFSFLERANWLIFQDAYPQLLLYEESKIRGEPLFDLLSEFSVSKFMKLAWNKHWKKHNVDQLTVSLIINEQHYIEERVMQNSHFQKTVLETFEFKMQELLKMNHILFPYMVDGQIHFSGKTIHHFTSLDGRIAVGRELYELVLKNDCIKKWAFQQQHTGSRKDYWPHFYNDIQEDFPNFPLVVKAVDCKLLNGKSRFYSPRLENAWGNVQHPDAGGEDWYSSYKSIKKYLTNEVQVATKPILESYCKSLDLLQAAAVAKKMLLPWQPQDNSDNIEGFTHH